MEIEECLDHIIVLDFFVGVLRGVGQSIVAPEHEVTESDLVVAFLSVNAFAVVENVDSEIFGLQVWHFVELLRTFEHFDVHGSRSWVSWADDNLFLEDDSVLGGHVGIGVFNWFALNDLGQSKCLLVTESVNNKLALVCVVRHHSLENEEVAMAVVRLEFHVDQIHLIQDCDLLSFRLIVFSWSPVDNLDPHVVEQVFICWQIDLDVHDGVLVSLVFLFGNLELVFSK